MQTKYFSNKIVTPFGKFDSKKEYYEFLRLKDMEKSCLLYTSDAADE